MTVFENIEIHCFLLGLGQWVINSQSWERSSADRLLWKASELEARSVRRIEKADKARRRHALCFSGAWNLVCIENKLVKKKCLRILRANRLWELLDYFLWMTAGKKCRFAKLAPMEDERRVSPFCYVPGSWSIRWLSCWMCKFSVPWAILHKAAATRPW